MSDMEGVIEKDGLRIKDGIILNPDCDNCGNPHFNLEHDEESGMYCCTVCGGRTPDDLIYDEDME